MNEENPNWTPPPSLQTAQAELASNPVGCSRASRDVLIANWGRAEYMRRLRAAMEATGADNMRVDWKK